MSTPEVNTDDYDFYSDYETTGGLQRSFYIDPDTGDKVYDPKYLFTKYNNSTMDMDDVNTGLMNDFWTDYPIIIDVNGNVFYNNEYTGINVRGPQGITNIRWENLTPEQIETLKGQDGAPGINGTNGQDGVDGKDGLSAYEVWLEDNGWLDDPEDHPLSEFYAFLGTYSNIVKPGVGNGSLIVNFNGEENEANGVGSFAAGLDTIANGNYSATFGYNTEAQRDYSFAIGKYNVNKATNMFEIGNGTSLRDTNIFEIDYSGNATAAGDITDGAGNVLSNKVDKVTGKVLSTNDFTNTYKSILDNYHVDDQLSTISENPVQNKVIKNELDRIQLDTTKVRQYLEDNDSDLPIAHPDVQNSGDTSTIRYSNVLTFNPYKQNLILGTTTTNNKVLGFGEGLLTNNDHQIVLGYYNDPELTDILEIGAGTSVNRKNILRLTTDGDLITGGQITDNLGNRLSDKQDKLTFDTAPTKNSTNPVTSGGIFDYLKAHGIDPEGGIDQTEINNLKARCTALETAVTNLTNALNSDVTTINNRITSEVTTLNNRITTVANTHELVDEFNYSVYTYGVYDNDFYIRPPEIPDPEPEEQEEQGE